MFSLKTRDWYHIFVKKHLYNLEDESHPLIASRIEFLYPNVDHVQSNHCIRITGLSSSLSSALFCLKNYLFPTMERLHRCGKESSPRCPLCSRRDDHGHFLMCSGLRYVCGPIIDSVRKLQSNIPLERVVNVDFSGSEEEIFTLLDDC